MRILMLFWPLNFGRQKTTLKFQMKIPIFIRGQNTGWSGERIHVKVVHNLLIRRYGLESLRKTPTKGTPPKDQDPTSRHLALFLQHQQLYHSFF